MVRGRDIGGCCGVRIYCGFCKSPRVPPPPDLLKQDRIPSVRKVILGLGISLDGYIARPDGSVDFLFMPKDYSMAPFFATVDAAIMGRKTCDVALKLGGGSFGGSPLVNYVMSRSLPPGERN